MADNDEQHENYTFESADAGSSLTFPMQCSALRKNGHVMIKGHPCKIVDMSTSKTGKHGHAKVHLVAIDIFTKAKYEDLSPSTHNMDVPNVSKKEYLLLDLDSSPGGFLSLMNDDGTEKEDVKTPEGDDPDVQKLRQRLIDAHKNGAEAYVLVLSAMGQEAAIEVKEKSTS